MPVDYLVVGHQVTVINNIHIEVVEQVSLDDHPITGVDNKLLRRVNLLVELARKNGASYLFEASVGGGIPLLPTGSAPHRNTGLSMLYISP